MKTVDQRGSSGFGLLAVLAGLGCLWLVANSRISGQPPVGSATAVLELEVKEALARNHKLQMDALQKIEASVNRLLDQQAQGQTVKPEVGKSTDIEPGPIEAEAQTWVPVVPATAVAQPVRGLRGRGLFNRSLRPTSRAGFGSCAFGSCGS